MLGIILIHASGDLRWTKLQERGRHKKNFGETDSILKAISMLLIGIYYIIYLSIGSTETKSLIIPNCIGSTYSKIIIISDQPIQKFSVYQMIWSRSYQIDKNKILTRTDKPM